jgi:hypothetical protein
MPISHACSRRKIKVVEIWRPSGGSFSGGFINLAIKLASATSANKTGKEKKDENKANNANDREDSSNCACIMKETDERLAGISSNYVWRTRKHDLAQ